MLKKRRHVPIAECKLDRDQASAIAPALVPDLAEFELWLAVSELAELLVSRKALVKGGLLVTEAERQAWLGANADRIYQEQRVLNVEVENIVRELLQLSRDAVQVPDVREDDREHFVHSFISRRYATGKG